MHEPDSPNRDDGRDDDGREGGERLRYAEDIRRTCIDAAVEAYEDARIRGLCHEGAWEAALGALKTADLSEIGRHPKD